MNPNKIPKNGKDPKTQESSTRAAFRNIDYISQLPRGVLHQILYFLPFEYWIILTMVSRQWKDLLRETPILILNEDDILFKMTKRQLRCIFHVKDSKIDGHDHPNESSLEENKRRYREFVETTLLGHSGCRINFMHLSFQYEPKNQNRSMVDNWVQFMMTRDIEELDLNFYTNPIFQIELEQMRVPYTKSSTIYEIPCKSFEPKFKCLALSSCKFKASCFGVFSNLRKLYLYNALVFDSSIGELLSKCPVLEDLHMEKCFVSTKFFQCEKDLNIKYLTLSNCVTEDWLMYELDISVPNLLIFVIKGLCLMSSSIRKASNLVECTIDIQHSLSDIGQGNLLAEFLIGLKHCKNLALSSWCIQVMATINTSLCNQLHSSFTNLVQLKLTIGYAKQELAGMVVLLQLCPFLESLILEFDAVTNINWFEKIEDEHEEFLPEAFIFEEDNYLETRIPKIPSLQYHLKDIEIRGFLGIKEEMHLLKYLIQNAEVLKNLVICFNGPKGGLGLSTPQQSKIYQQSFLYGLLKLPKLSHGVNVSVQDDYVPAPAVIISYHSKYHIFPEEVCLLNVLGISNGSVDRIPINLKMLIMELLCDGQFNQEEYEVLLHLASFLRNLKVQFK